MDNFREWLSDNLRYFMLGFAILAVLLVLFFGARFISSLLSSDESGEEQKVSEEVTPTEEPDGEQEAEATPEAPEENSYSLKKDAYPEVNQLISTYYTALGNRDIATLRQTLDQISQEEEEAVAASSYIEGYYDVEVYTRQGVTENSYVVLACYNHKYASYDTLLPGVSCLYVDTVDGALKIISEPSEEQQNYVNALMETQEVKDLLAAKQQDYDAALTANPELSEFLASLENPEATPEPTAEPTPEATPEPTAEPTPEVTAEPTPETTPEPVTPVTRTIKKDCNVRSKAATSSKKLGEVQKGQEVTQTGEEKGWIVIEFEGQNGYIWREFVN